MSILFMMTFTKLSLKWSRPKLFYTFIGFFIAFFALFAWVLYPFRHEISHGDAWAKTQIDKGQMPVVRLGVHHEKVG